MNFIQANDKFINLEQVASINMLKGRIAYDMSCPVELDSGKIISYYAYNDHDKNDNAEKELLNHPYVKKHFNIHGDILVNMKQVAAIKFVREKLRIIYNFSHSTTSLNFNKEPRLTSKFIYVHFNTLDEFDEFCDKLRNTIKE